MQHSYDGIVSMWSHKQRYWSKAGPALMHAALIQLIPNNHLRHLLDMMPHTASHNGYTMHPMTANG